MTKNDRHILPRNFASPGYRSYLIFEGHQLRAAMSSIEPPILQRDKWYPGATIWVVDRDYSITHEIINIETGEARSYLI